MNFHIKTYGCKLNQSDSEIIRDILLEKHQETSLSDADFVILNTCGVVEKTERKILKEAEKIKDKKIIITGCLPMISLEECQKVSDGIIGPTNLLSINKIVDGIIKVDIKKTKTDKVKLKKSSSKIIPIAEGCLGNCTYCATKFARKGLFSFSAKEIIKKVKESNSSEIYLTSQDLSVYGMDRGESLSLLLKEIVKIDRDFKIKLGMMNPKYVTEELLNIYESDKIYNFIHLPLQSGDNDLLKKMNRGYKVEDFTNIVKKFRKKFKESIIATDIIIGHPLETEESFNKTLKVIEEVKPEVLHIFKFSKRKGTADFNLKDLPDRIKKDRSRIVTELFENYNYEKNKKYIGKKLEVLIVEKRKNNYLSRTDSGRAVAVKEGLIGEKAKVKIIDCKWNYLIGEV
ncbi:MAG: threonylcarbamoyladenosine tRNA methylthiotransferase [Patescibacteria group bacterium]|nr:threonylcarbamoyladenosine tRNA methylthiotransferase [Patescibacteria group bacterium]